MAQLKRAAGTSLHEKAKVEALFASIGEGLVVTDDNGHIERVNQVALDIFGYTEDEVLGKPYIEKIIATYENGKPLDLIERPMGKALLTGKVISDHIFYRRKDQTTVPVQITISPLLLKGIPIGTVQLIRDISSEVTIDKLKSDFLSIASHQLRTPLSSVNIYAGMLLEGLGGKLTKDQKSYVETILNSASRMNQLIDTLLNITHIEAGGIDVKHTRTHLPMLISEIISELQPLLDAKDMSFQFLYLSKVHYLISDSLLIKEVLVNLLTNAIRYTPQGGSIELRVESDRKRFVFCVADNGYGIPKNMHSRVFSKFFRSDNILDEEVSGTGLGLYLIKMIADQLDGELWFESEENVGSSFYFCVPRLSSLAVSH